MFRKRLLCLTKYPESGSSSRYRFLQFREALEREGWEVGFQSLLGPDYIPRFNAGQGMGPWHLMGDYARRLGNLVAGGWDLLWIEKELFPFLPAWLERLLLARRVPWVLDYDDATFHVYDGHPSALVRKVLGRKIDRLMGAATGVVVGNEYLAARARRAGAKRVLVLPTLVDAARHPALTPEGPKDFVIGWIGSPSTQVYLQEVQGLLAELCREPGVRVKVVGTRDDFALPDVPLERHPWTQATEVPLLRSCSVGIMPLPKDNPFVLGKCGLKIIQYMACHLPAVATNLGANREIIVEGVTGWLADGPEDWLRALRGLRTRPDMARAQGEAGYTRFLERFSLQGRSGELCGFLKDSLSKA